MSWDERERIDTIRGAVHGAAEDLVVVAADLIQRGGVDERAIQRLIAAANAAGAADRHIREALEILL